MRIYFDICALQRPLDDLSQLRVRLEAEAMLTLIQCCEEGMLEMVISAAHEIENAQNPSFYRRMHIDRVLSLARHRVQSHDPMAERINAYTNAGL